MEKKKKKENVHFRIRNPLSKQTPHWYPDAAQYRPTVPLPDFYRGKKVGANMSEKKRNTR